MNLENDLFMMKKQQIVQIELAEAAREQKGLTPPEGGDRFLPAPAISAGSVPTYLPTYSIGTHPAPHRAKPLERVAEPELESEPAFFGSSGAGTVKLLRLRTKLKNSFLNCRK